MSLFQKSVLKQHLKSLDTAKLDAAYQVFTDHFHNITIQANIRNNKEEQYQAEFLRDLFVNVFGYILNPSENFNLETERKNETDAKKVDGAILQDGKVLAVIELKGTNTKDLDKVADQAFGYKSNQTGCNYVITSNFEKLRFYIDDKVTYEEFNLFELNKEQFKLLWLCTSSDTLLNGIPKKIKGESLTEEETVTKKLYKDYSSFRNAIFDNICKQNEQYDKLTLFKKTQKLLDRFLFIFFAEDRGLLPANSIRTIINQWESLAKLDAYKPLYERFNQYFGYMNTGRKEDSHEIFAYNGGLFAPDDILDTISISDELLHQHTQRLSDYDFESEVSVNILGHIFEHSLNDIEEIQNELAGIIADKSKSKRKKDGVFYTPKYITKYIVDNTIGKLCTEKKTELTIEEQDYIPNRKQQTKQKLQTQLDSYRQWLLELTICDPACGSGAFLNQALEFLIAEHRYIDELQANLYGDALILSEVENSILENNLYGVDINGESIEIAKLSLWLRTAQKGRKLTTLNDNIKCGNSLIDDPSVAVDKAFNWQEEFPHVFEKGGFDVVIGNPPYVKRQNLSDENQILFLEKNYQSATYNFDLYLLFIEKASKLINENGLVSYINPSKFTSTKTGEGLRLFIDTNCKILTYIDFKEFQVFDDATTYCCIFILNNEKKGKMEYLELNELTPIDIDSFTRYEIEIKENASSLGWQFKPTIEIKTTHYLKDYVETITGIESGADSLYILEKDNPVVDSIVQYEGDIVFPVIKGTNVYRYYFEENAYYGIVPYSSDRKLISAETIENDYSNVWSYLVENKEVLEGREKGKMKTEGWYGYVYPKNLYKYSNDRLIWTDISIKPQFVIDTTKSWHVRTVCSLELNETGIEKGLSLNLLLAILNSNLFFYFIKNNSNSVRGGYFRYKPQYVKEFPIPDKLSEESIKTVEKTIEVIKALTERYVRVKNTFKKYIQSQFLIEKLPKKLQNWHDLEFGDFINELNKVIKKSGGEKLDDKAQFSLMSLFEEQKTEAQNLKTQIDQTDREIDQMVYQLYDLTTEEITIIEETANP